MVEYKYNAWGKHVVLGESGNVITSETHIGNLNPFRYRGYYYDTETGLYFLKTRYYDPEVGRFITMDDVSYLDPENINGLNLYAYCGNNPVMNVDPSGQLFFTAIILAFLGGFVSSFGINVGMQWMTNGWDGIDWRGAVAQGFLGGVFGALCALGGGIALGLVHMSTCGALAITGMVSLAAGIGAYGIQYGGTDNFNVMDMIGAGFIAMIQGYTSLLTGAIMGGSGFYTNLQKGHGILTAFKSSTIFLEYSCNLIVRTVIKSILVSPLSFVFKLIQEENNARSKYGS